MRLRDWAAEILTNVAVVAEVIDSHEGGASYMDSVRLMRQLVEDPAATPSARVLSDLEETRSSFFEYVLALASNYSDYFASIASLDDARKAVLEKEAFDSLRRQQEIEEADEISLDDYLQQYFSNY